MGTKTMERWLPAVLLLGIITFWAGFMTVSLRQASLDDEASGAVVAVFSPSVGAGDMFTSILQAGGRYVNTTWLSSAWVVHSDAPGFARRLRQSGALAVFRPSLFQSITTPGCFLTLPPPG